MTKSTTTTTSKKTSPSVAMVTPCFMGRDGVGNTIRDYLQALATWQWETHLYHSHRGLSVAGLTDHCIDMGSLLLEVMEDKKCSFFDFDYYVYQYVFHYPLLETIRTLNKGRVIVEYHGITPPHFFPQEDPYHEKANDILARHELLDYADGVVVHSHSMKKELLQLHSVPAERVHVLPLGVDGRYSAGPPKKDIREKYAPHGEKLLLYVGRLSGNKNATELIEGLALLPKETKCSLILLGAHERTTTPLYLQEIEKKIRELGLSQSVHLVDQVSDEELPGFYRSTDLFVTASLHEGFCIPVAEAMSCGTPCVVPNFSATPETMGEGGLTYEAHSAKDLAQKIMQALDEKEQKILQEKALKTSAKYSPEAFQERLKSLFHAVSKQERRLRPPLSQRAAILKASANADFYYDDLSPKTLVGEFIRWFRRKLTLPLEVSMVRKQRDRQRLVNEMLTDELQNIQKEVSELRSQLDKH